MERFVKEYANYQKRKIEQNPDMQAEIKQKALERINKALNLRRMMYITADESIRIILNCIEEN